MYSQRNNSYNQFCGFDFVRSHILRYVSSRGVKINKMPEFYVLFARKINTIAEFFMIFAWNAHILHHNCPKNIFKNIFRGEGARAFRSHPPPMVDSMWLRTGLWNERDVSDAAVDALMQLHLAITDEERPCFTNWWRSVNAANGLRHRHTLKLNPAALEALRGWLYTMSRSV